MPHEYKYHVQPVLMLQNKRNKIDTGNFSGKKKKPF